MIESFVIKNFVVYICSKYSGNVSQNTERAKEYCRLAVNLGVVPIAPHLLFPQFMSDDNERKRAMEMDKILLEKCDQMWVFIDEFGDISKGMKSEMEEAKRLNISIIYIGDNENCCSKEKTQVAWFPIDSKAKPIPYESVFIKLAPFPGCDENIWIAHIDYSGKWIGMASKKKITRKIDAWAPMPDCAEHGGEKNHGEI